MEARHNEPTPMVRPPMTISRETKADQPRHAGRASDRLTVQFDCNPLMALAWDAVQRGYLSAMS